MGNYKKNSKLRPVRSLGSSLILKLAVCGSLGGQLAGTALAVDDFDCYSSDQRVWVSGRTAERADGSEYFFGSVQLSFDGSAFRTRIQPSEFAPGSVPFNFSASSSQYKLRLNWQQRHMEFSYFPEGSAAPSYTYSGGVTCD